MISDETKKFIRERRYENSVVLALKYRNKPDAAIDYPFAIAQIAGRQAIEHKLPSWYACDDLVYPGHLPLEQCSSELTARYKASLIEGGLLADLTGGFGVDCAFLSRRFRQAIYVEQQVELCKIARNNFEALGLAQVAIENVNALDFLAAMQPVDCIYLDPARRGKAGNKTVAIEDCDPDIGKIKGQLLQKADIVLIKLSPMLDISLALQILSETFRIHVVSVDNECKELLFMLKNGAIEEPEICCVNLSGNAPAQTFSFCKSAEKAIVPDYTAELSGYLYEPNASILKAGGYKSVAAQFRLKKLHPDSHLYTSPVDLAGFPGRKFRIESVFSFNKKELKENLENISRANISIRNFPGSTDGLRKKLKLKDGGEIYLFATTLADGKKVIIKGVK